MKCCLLSLLFLISCSPANLAELRCEAESEIKKLIVELEKIETIEDIQHASKKLKKRFNRLAFLLIETRNFPSQEEQQYESVAGEQLFTELARLYEIPGARAVIENAQNEAVRRLDHKTH
jgi:hypothetical protein